jgi:hypothetical protein
MFVRPPTSRRNTFRARSTCPPGRRSRPGRARLPYDRHRVPWRRPPTHCPARHALTLIGLDRVIGWAAASRRRRQKAGPLERSHVDVKQLSKQSQNCDRRSRRHGVSDARPRQHLFLGDSPSSRRIPVTRHAVHCQGGPARRSRCLLQARCSRTSPTLRGIRAWEAAGLPVERDPESP